MLNKFRKFNFKGFTLVELMVVVAILGILAVIAVPAFIKYMRRAKTTEASTNWTRFTRARPTTTPPGTSMPPAKKIHCQFPADQGTTPAASCCEATPADTDKDDRCDSNSWHGTRRPGQP